MPTKFRPITQAERVQQIAIGLFLALIFATTFGFIASSIFQWVAGFFDPNPGAPRDCNILEYLADDKSISEYKSCKTQSNSFESRMERLGEKIPWFWMAFIFLGWVLTRNALKGRIRDDSEDVSYPGQGAWGIVLTALAPAIFYIAIWVIAARDAASFTALGVLIFLILASIITHRWLLKTYGRTKAEQDAD